MVAQWAPQLISTSSLPIEKPGFPAQPSPSTVQVAAATPGLPQPTASAQTAPQEFAPTAAPISPELTQLLQTMARDLPNVQQGIEQLKTSQEELARENGRTAEQLKASQEQMARAIANALRAEQGFRAEPAARHRRPRRCSVCYRDAQACAGASVAASQGAAAAPRPSCSPTTSSRPSEAPRRKPACRSSVREAAIA